MNISMQTAIAIRYYLRYKMPWATGLPRFMIFVENIEAKLYHLSAGMLWHKNTPGEILNTIPVEKSRFQEVLRPLMLILNITKTNWLGF